MHINLKQHGCVTSCTIIIRFTIICTDTPLSLELFIIIRLQQTVDGSFTRLNDLSVRFYVRYSNVDRGNIFVPMSELFSLDSIFFSTHVLSANFSFRKFYVIAMCLIPLVM